MKCKNEDGCNGTLDCGQPVAVKIDCSQSRDAIPCDTCGRLHFIEKDRGLPLWIDAKKRAFAVDGQVVGKR